MSLYRIKYNHVLVPEPYQIFLDLSILDKDPAYFLFEKQRYLF